MSLSKSEGVVSWYFTTSYLFRSWVWLRIASGIGKSDIITGFVNADMLSQKWIFTGTKIVCWIMYKARESLGFSRWLLVEKTGRFYLGDVNAGGWNVGKTGEENWQRALEAWNNNLKGKKYYIWGPYIHRKLYIGSMNSWRNKIIIIMVVVIIIIVVLIMIIIIIIIGNGWYG